MLVVGTISIVDLRLLGVASLDRAVSRLMHDVLPYTWGAFVIAAITGSLMFSSDAVNYAHNFFFRGKLVLLTLAGLNMAVFHIAGIGDVARWGITQANAVTGQSGRRRVAACMDNSGRVWSRDRLHNALK